MKSFDSRTYSISDFVDWDNQKKLELNPSFQRRAVWSEKAKSYLMDTIIRGKPIPKVFIRQKLNVTTKTSTRDVVDGQQRLKAILSFIKDGFAISRTQNKENGGRRFSQLPPEVQASILSYEISVDLLINLDDAEVLDIFSRLNSYAIVLNEQEKLNANCFSAFKILADKLGRKYTEYWIKQDIVPAAKVLRMQEVNLVADLLIAMREGIKSKKQIKRYYESYEQSYSDDVDTVEACFDATLGLIGKLFTEGLLNTEFNRPQLFYSLFTAVYHILYGIKNVAAARPTVVTEAEVQNARNKLDHVTELFEVPDILAIESAVDRQFLLDCRDATTDEVVRVRRAKYLVELITNVNKSITEHVQV